MKQLQNAKHVGVTVTADGDDVVVTATPASVGAAPASHNHDDRYYTESQVDSLLGDKQDSSSAFDGQYGSLSGIPGTFPPSAHSHSLASLTDVDTSGATEGHVLSYEGGEWVPKFGDGGGEFSGSYLDLMDVPDTFAPSAHNHAIGEVTGLQGALNDKLDSASAFSGDYDDLSNKPSLFDGSYNNLDDVPGTFAPSAHGHVIGDVTNLQTALNDKLDVSAAFDGDYDSLSNIPATFAPSPHSHTISDVTGLQGALNDKQDAATAFDGEYASLGGIPSTFTPASHTHSAADIDAGTLADARIPSLNASKINAGEFSDARIPSLNASKITSGTLGVARGGTGAASLTSGSFLRGNGTSAVSLRTPAQVKSDIDAMDKHFVVNNQTGASYTLSLADDGALVTRNNGSANTLTIPTNASVAFPVGTVINFAQVGAGVTTVVASAGVTLNGVVAGSAAVSKQYSAGSLVKIATNTWIVTGPVEDVS